MEANPVATAPLATAGVDCRLPQFHRPRVLNSFAGLRALSGRRATGFALAIALEVLLILALLTLGRTVTTRRQEGEALNTFNVAPPADKNEEAAPSEAEAESKPLQRKTPQPKPEEQKEETPPLPTLMPMPAFDLANVVSRPRPPAPSKPVAGPSAAGIPGDTPLMAGTGPNGEPLYAAQWYREPTDRELSGYLSSADGPGWGLIACKTEPEYRVDQCVILGEYPGGSRIANAVLQASWQFRVRPPRKGGKSLIGEWVGIRIDYGMKPRY